MVIAKAESEAQEKWVKWKAWKACWAIVVLKVSTEGVYAA